MVSKIITLKNKTGLHSRPAASFVKKANGFKSTVKIKKDNQEIDGKSIISLLTLGAGYESRIKLTIEGDDEEKAMNELVEFFDQLID
ncbi:MAG: HPr family phosphocarrier protein [Lutispora sp.]|nr:HPr family phosphocarrier protein [Lutispora sp.]